MAATHRRWPLVVGGLLISILVLLAVAVVAGAYYLDGVLLAAAREQAAKVGARTGRTVEIQGVATKLLGGVGVRVSGLSVGPGPGEDRPLASLKGAELEVDLVGALRSRGKSVVIKKAVLEGLRVNVIRFPDGTTNAERLSKRLAETAPPEAPKPAEPAPTEPPAEGTPLDVSGVRFDRAAVSDARIGFLDLTVPGAKELAVDHIDVAVSGLAAGLPLTVQLDAAVLSEKRNLLVALHAAPLPPTLVPTFTSASLRVDPIDLSPLLPFLPASVGLRAGAFRADLQASLGAAAAGGTGPTTVKGSLAATGLAFAALETGRPFDVTLALDLAGDAAKGDLTIGKLDLAFGPAALTGSGHLLGLAGDAPKVEGLQITGRNLDLEALAALAPPLRKALGDAVVAGPIGLSVRGAGGAGAQRVTLDVDLTPVRLAVPHQLAKAAGAPASLKVSADVAGGSRVRFDAALDLAGLDLRPGGTLAKAPGQPLALAARGTARAAAGATEVALEAVTLDLLADRLTGTAKVATAGSGGKATLRFDAAVQGERLDLDKLLLPTPKDARPAPAPAPAAAPPDPKAFAGLAGTATARLALLRSEGVDVKDVVLKLDVAEDQVTLTEARLGVFGGTVKADGTTVALARDGQPVTLKLDLKDVAAKGLITALSTYDVLDGKLDAKVELSGKGLTPKKLLGSLNGSLGGLLAGGVLRGTDLVAGVTGPLSKKLPFAAKAVDGGGAAGAGGARGTPLGKELPFDLAVADGKARFTKPLAVETGRGTLKLEGGFGLDGALALPATLALSPETVATLTLGKVKVAEPLPIGFTVAGPAWKPRVEDLKLDGAVKSLATAAATGALGKAGVDVGAVKEQAADAKAKAAAEAKQAAEDAKKKLQEEAKKKLKGLFGQ